MIVPLSLSNSWEKDQLFKSQSIRYLYDIIRKSIIWTIVPEYQPAILPVLRRESIQLVRQRDVCGFIRLHLI